MLHTYSAKAYTVTLVTLIFALSLVGHSAKAQKHKATQAEVDFNNSVLTALYSSLPKNYNGWDRDYPIGDAEDRQMSVGDVVSDCQGDECYEWIELIATYSGTRTQTSALVALQKQIAAAKSDEERRALEWKMNNNYTLSIRLMVNVTNDVVEYSFCKDNGYQKIQPPANWDAHIFATLAPCKKDSNRDLGDINFFTMGVPPTLSNGHNIFKLDPALKGKHKVQNIVLYIEGDKDGDYRFCFKNECICLEGFV
jgi:hypothetical protein